MGVEIASIAVLINSQLPLKEDENFVITEREIAKPTLLKVPPSAHSAINSSLDDFDWGKSPSKIVFNFHADMHNKTDINMYDFDLQGAEFLEPEHLLASD